MASRIRRTAARADRWRRRLSWSTTEVVWLGLAALVAAGAVVGLAGVSEDVVRHNGLASTDPHRLQIVIDHRTPWLDHAAKVASTMGSAPVLLVLAVLAAVALYALGKPVLVALTPMLALAVGAGVAEAMKLGVGRARPAASLQLVTETAPSFPSGHSTDSAAFYVALGLVVALFVLTRPWARAVVVALAGTIAAAIGASRLVLGVHWPSDVLAGLLLGTAVAVVAVTASYLVAKTATGATRSRSGVAGVLLRTRTPGRPNRPGFEVSASLRPSLHG